MKAVWTLATLLLASLCMVTDATAQHQPFNPGRGGEPPPAADNGGEVRVP